MKAVDIIHSYISFFKKRGHKQIPGASLVPENDPTTLFTSSGMQPLVPYLLGEKHPAGTRLVDVQNSFRAVDIEEIGNNRHTTFFRMLGNWSLGDYFKKEQIPWIFEFLTKELKLPVEKLYFTVFEGNDDVPKDTEAVEIWESILKKEGLNPQEKIFYYGVNKNWWSRSGPPDKMPPGEPGGPDSEVFYDFGKEFRFHEQSPWKNEKCHVNCDCGRFIEICNSVFMQYRKKADGNLELLPKPNVDFGGGLERLLIATENQPDVFKSSLFSPIINSIERITEKLYEKNKKNMRIVADHFTASTFIISAGVKPSNKEQGYILRRLIRRAIDHLYTLKEVSITPILETIILQYKDTDPKLTEQFEEIKNTLLEEEQKYAHTRKEAKKYIEKKYQSSQFIVDGSQEVSGDELMGVKEISAEDAFYLYTSQGLSPTQIESLGYTFDKQKFAEKMEEHQKLSKSASIGKFRGGLADTQELTIKGHTATHLLQQALRDVLGNSVHQTGSNITTKRLRFDFNYEDKLTPEELKKVESIVRKKIKEDLPVHFAMLPLKTAKEIGAIGLFDEKYQDKVKVYFIGPSLNSGQDDSSLEVLKQAYSKEFCGGPHVSHTGVIKSFSLNKQEKIGHGQIRLYAVVQ